MAIEILIKKGAYYDSVTLMIVSKDLKKIDGVQEVIVGMGTDLNKELATNLGLFTDELSTATSNDFFIALKSENGELMQQVSDAVDAFLAKKAEASDGEYVAPTFDAALKNSPDSNLVVISIPGKYAYAEAKKAIDKGLHVMLFSDNVSIEEEKKLKEEAAEKGLLVMGPDCGTAIINNTPLAFANVINKGNIGIVGASGTGTQEVSVLIHKFGGGVSQVIGTGGRDLKKEIGGIMMKLGIKALAEDPETKVIVLISKPPSPEIAAEVLELAKQSGKPVVVDFIGGDPEMVKKYGFCVGNTLEDTAKKAVALSKNEEITDFSGFSAEKSEIDAIVNAAVAKLSKNQKYLRGLYTGGTLCDEAMKMMNSLGRKIYSNIPLQEEYMLKDMNKSVEDTCIDLGDDVFTVGRAHPMIDPTCRIERLSKELEDEEIAVVLMDFVIGYGSNADPAGEMLPVIKQGKNVIFVGYVCGTELDPQNKAEQEQKLKDAGVITMPSNAQAVRLVAEILSKIN